MFFCIFSLKLDIKKPSKSDRNYAICTVFVCIQFFYAVFFGLFKTNAKQTPSFPFICPFHKDTVLHIFLPFFPFSVFCILHSVKERGKLSFLWKSFPLAPFKNPLAKRMRGFAPAPHSLFEKSEPKTFICLRRANFIYSIKKAFRKSESLSFFYIIC